MNNETKAYKIMHILAGLCALPFGWAIYKLDDGYFNEWVMLGVICLLALYMIFIIVSVIKHKISIGRAISSIIGQFCNTIIAGIFIYYLVEFVEVHEVYDMLGHPTGRTESGFEAVLSDSWAHIVFIPSLTICSIYNIIYWKITHKKQAHKKKITTEQDSQV